MTAPYASADYTKSVMGSVQSTSGGTSINEDKLMSNLRVVSRRVDWDIFASRMPYFLPYKRVLRPLINPTLVNSQAGTFTLPSYLLELDDSPSVNGTTVAVEGYPDADMPPFTQLRLTDCCTSWYSVGCTDNSTPNRLTVAGIWGLHLDYANAWLAVDALAAAIVSTSATTFTVASAAGDDAYGQPYRISAGHLLKVDDEYMEVVGVSTNTITVVRGANGTTAATHLISATVYRWEVQEDVKRAVARQSGMMYARFGAYTVSEIQAMGEIRYPKDWLAEVMGTLQGYVNG